MRNILAKVPRLMQDTMKKLVQQVFLTPTYAVAARRGRDLIATFKDRYPAAIECLERDLDECITYLRFPEAHHLRIRTTNRLERLKAKLGAAPKWSRGSRPSARASRCSMRA
jgi:transposase-like protein